MASFIVIFIISQSNPENSSSFGNDSRNAYLRSSMSKSLKSYSISVISRSFSILLFGWLFNCLIVYQKSYDMSMEKFITYRFRMELQEPFSAYSQSLQYHRIFLFINFVEFFQQNTMLLMQFILVAQGISLSILMETLKNDKCDNYKKFHIINPFRWLFNCLVVYQNSYDNVNGVNKNKLKIKQRG